MGQADKELKVLILSVQTMIREVTIRARQWTQANRMDNLTDEQWVVWCNRTIDDTLNGLMRWVEGRHDSAFTYLTENLPWTMVDENEDLFTSFEDFVLLDVVRKYVTTPLYAHVGVTWKVWTTRQFDDDLAVEEGMDYRVMEWYRLSGKELPTGHEARL